MKLFSGSRLIAVVLLTILVVVAVGRAYIDDSETFESIPKNTSESINKIKIEFKDSKIFLNVYLNNITTCENVIELLGIQDVSIRNKTYVPNCSVVDDKFIQIVYKEITGS